MAKKKTNGKKTVATGKRRAQGKRRVREESCWWALPVSCLMILILAVTAFLAVHEISENRRFRIMRAAVESDGFYSGIIVEGYALTDVTLDTALKHWEDRIEPAYADRTVTLTYNGQTWSKTCRELGYSSNYREVLGNAWSRARSGTLEQRYRSLRQIGSAQERYEITRTLYDEAQLRAWTDGIAASLTVDPVNAQVTGFDVDTRKFTFASSAVGYSVDADALYRQASAALNGGGATVQVAVNTVEPTKDSSDVNGRFGMITQAVTNASSSNKNRLTNLRLACAALNGYCIQPGETFSFNQVVGQRTAKRGYKKATVYQSGELAEDIGGGVCQVSTTLWNAAMKANCEIVERSEHSRTVAYVDKGKDATVSWPGQDMKFKNTSSSPMYLVCYVSDNKRVYCEVYGELFPNGRYITIEAKTTQTVKPDDPVYTYNPLLGSGQEVVVSEARKGYRAEAYRVYHSADGSEIKRVLLCKSYYKPARAQIEYG